MSYRFADRLRAGSGRNVLILLASCLHTYVPLLCVQWKTPDDVQRNCPKHVEFYSKNKFEKLIHLVDFIIRIYHDARSIERQKSRSVNFLLCNWHRAVNISCPTSKHFLTPPISTVAQTATAQVSHSYTTQANYNFNYFNTCTVHVLLFCTMTNKCIINWQICQLIVHLLVIAQNTISIFEPPCFQTTHWKKSFRTERWEASCLSVLFLAFSCKLFWFDTVALKYQQLRNNFLPCLLVSKKEVRSCYKHSSVSKQLTVF